MGKVGGIRMRGLTPSTISGSLQLSSVPQSSGHKTLDDEADLKSDLEVFFSSLSKKFFEDGILDWPKRWEYFIGSKGVYVMD